MDLGPGECRWPVDDPAGQRRILFCGEPADPQPMQGDRRCPYCARHRALAYRVERPGEKIDEVTS